MTAMITVVVGQYSKVDIAVGPALFFALAMVATAAMFLAIGALTSQLAATRRLAASYAAMVLGVSYAIRMIADAGIGVHAMIWLSPLGWVEELQPLTGSRPLALIPIVAFIAVMAAVSTDLAGRRDVGASVVGDRSASGSHMRLLSGPLGLTVRLVRPTAIGWWIAIAVTSLLYGFIAKSAGGAISGSSMQEFLSKLGASGSGTNAVLGVCFLVLAILIAFIAAGQLTAARSEESEGRVDHLIVRPVSRSGWLSARVAVAVAMILVGAVAAGAFAWLGAASQDAAVSFPRLLEAGVNLVPPSVAILGLGVLTFGVWPRAASIVVYSVLGWSVLVVVVGGIGATSHWILDTSVFHQMSSAPAVAPHWRANATMVAIGVAGAALGGVAFSRRDLQGE